MLQKILMCIPEILQSKNWRKYLPSTHVTFFLYLKYYAFQHSFLLTTRGINLTKSILKNKTKIKMWQSHMFYPRDRELGRVWKSHWVDRAKSWMWELKKFDFSIHLIETKLKEFKPHAKRQSIRWSCIPTGGASTRQIRGE